MYVNIEICTAVKEGEDNNKFMPFKAHASDAGFDIMAACDDSCVIEPFGTTVIPAGFRMELPFGYEAQIRSRSGNALKRKFQVANSPGTIDSAYRGEVGVIIFNASDKELVIKRGEKIAQMVIQKVPEVNLVKVNAISLETERSENGFGSTGK